MCVTFFCIYVSTLQLPTSALSTKVKREARGRKGSEEKRGKATQPSCDEHNPRGSEGIKKGKVKREE